MEFTRRQLKGPKPLGEVLKNARKKKNVSLDEAEEETKVRAKYLEALEEDDFEKLPPTVYAVGFLAKYADFLEIQKEPLIEQFVQERGLNPKGNKLMLERKIKEPVFSITPKIILISSIVLVVAGLISYIAFSVHRFTAPPNLEISSPSSEEIIQEDQVEIVGKTDEGSTLLINNQTVYLDDRGNFREQVKLNPGLNTFEIKAINQLKKEQTKVLKILAQFEQLDNSEQEIEVQMEDKNINLKP